MSVNPFMNNAKALPKSDSQIIRVPLDQLDLGGRKSAMPAEEKATDLAIKHVGSK